MEIAYEKTVQNQADFEARLRLDSALDAKFSLINYGESDITIVFSEDLTELERAALDGYVAEYVDQSPTQKIKAHLLLNVDSFVRDIKLSFLASNIENGITAAGKTKAVADYLRNLNYYLNNYSLYAAIEEIDALIAATVPAELSPFVTEQILTDTKTSIQTFLAG